MSKIKISTRKKGSIKPYINDLLILNFVAEVINNIIRYEKHQTRTWQLYLYLKHWRDSFQNFLFQLLKLRIICGKIWETSLEISENIWWIHYRFCNYSHSHLWFACCLNIYQFIGLWFFHWKMKRTKKNSKTRVRYFLAT